MAEETQTNQSHEQTIPHHHVLFEWKLHPYQPRNVNTLLKAEQAAAGFNTKLAVGLTQRVGTMKTPLPLIVTKFRVNMLY
jgi:hypothetical protein